MQAIILDRDGVIIKERGEYTYNMQDVELLHYNLDALKKYINSTNKNTQLFVLSNQGGIAKLLYGYKEMNEIHTYIQKAFNHIGLKIEEFFVCPHHPDYTNCFCRKPKDLLYQKICAKYNLTYKNCLMIGDKPRDTEPAITLGMRGLLIDSNQSLEGLL